MARLLFPIVVSASDVIATIASPTPAATGKSIGYEASCDYRCFATDCFTNCACATRFYVNVKTEDGKTTRFKIDDYDWETQTATTQLGKSGWQFQSTAAGEIQIAAAPSNSSHEVEEKGVACVKSALQTKREVYLGTDKEYGRCHWPF